MTIFCYERLDRVGIKGRGWLFVAINHAQRRSRNEERGEKDRASSHNLNITNGLTGDIILMVTPPTILSVEMSCHHIICFLESRCIIVRDVVSIYWQKFYVGIFTNEFYHQVNSSVM